MKPRYTPKGLSMLPLNKLLRMLQSSVEEERYEEAAIIRDAVEAARKHEREWLEKNPRPRTAKRA